jgi:hypothetical protein
MVAEQWGRRWIMIDTSRVALALARARVMGARYPYYLLADSRDGQPKEAEVTRTAPSSKPVHDNVRHGFVYERVPNITLFHHLRPGQSRAHGRRHRGLGSPVCFACTLFSGWKSSRKSASQGWKNSPSRPVGEVRS